MLGLFGKKKQGEEVVIKISGMHCTSCAMNVDGALEDLEGVIEAKTSYAKQEVRVLYNPEQVKVRLLIEAVENLGYEASV